MIMAGLLLELGIPYIVAGGIVEALTTEGKAKIHINTTYSQAHTVPHTHSYTYTRIL